MGRLRLPARSALWLVCLLAFVRPHVAYGAQWSLSADFDGDGKPDWAAVDREDSRLLHVHLSHTRQTTVIRSKAPIRALAVTNLDGDQRPELVVRAGGRGLKFWRGGDSRFHRVRVAKPFSTGISLPRKRVQAGALEGSPALASGSAPPAAAWYAGAGTRAPDSARRVGTARSGARVRRLEPHAPLSPRPPPSLT